MPDALSLRAFGRRQGVSDTAVRKAIRTGRLQQSVGTRDGKPVIVDAELADREWAARTSRPPRQPRSDATSTTQPPAPAKAPDTLVDIQRAIAVQRERKLRLDNDERERRLLPFDVAQEVQQAHAAAVKGQLLAVSRRAVLAGLPPDHEPLVRRLIVDALRELAEIRTFAELVNAGDAA